MRSIDAFLVVLALVAGTLLAGCEHPPEGRVADPASRRTLSSGDVVGFRGQYESHAWLGISYASPPVGARRWRAPQPPEGWTGTRAALELSPPCTQFASALGGIDDADRGDPVGSEDCLYLNVWAPRFTPDEVPAGPVRLPVMVWIHGGGNVIGQGGFYNGGNLAATHKVIVVSFNYRLGPFGWFRHAALRGEGTDEADRSGNFGTLDHIRALEWVRDNISAFGGDPGNVTIFGESAGGLDVYMLLLAPQAAGLFHRAVVESGGLWTTAPSEAENLADDAVPGHRNSSGEVLLRLLVADGTARDRAAAKKHAARMSPDEIESYLRSKGSFEILSMYKDQAVVDMIDMPRVFRDGFVLPAEDSVQRLASGGYNQVPVIAGTNRDEDKLFMFLDPKRVRRILWIFPRLRDRQHYELAAEYLGKMWKATGADEPAAAMRAVQGPSVFVYRFDWDEEPTILGADLSVMVGAAHAFEIPFVFGHFDLGKEGNVIFTRANEPGRKVLSSEMMSYWAQFAYSGSPGRGRDGELPEWAPWDNGGGSKFLVLDTASGGAARMSSESLTRASVLAAIDDDPRLPDQRAKCSIYRELALRDRGFTREEYPSAGRQGCARFPLDGYPWG